MADIDVTETKTEGLERGYKVVVPATFVDARVEAELRKVQGQTHLKGFRPGKAPIAHLRKLYGEAVVGQVVQDLVNEQADKAMSERDLRAAAPPDVRLLSDAQELAKGGAPLSFELSLEVMPEFDPIDPAGLSVVKKTAEVEDEAVETSLQQLLDALRGFEPKEGPAVDGDKVTIDFVGTIDGEKFEGGSAEGVDLVLGAGRFLADFETGLKDAAAGEERTIEATFPEDYPAVDLQGKTARFDVKVTAVSGPEEVAMDDAFAQRAGAESMDDLRTKMRERIEAQYGQFSRQHLKRDILDKLDSSHDFELPPKMVRHEFDHIWARLEDARKHGQTPPEDEGKSDEELRTEYQAIAERRVRLGFVLAEIGRKNGVEVSDDEVWRAVAQQAQDYPGREREVVEHYRNNPRDLLALRAPILEEKVIDFIAELAKVETVVVDREELEKDPDERPIADADAAAAA